jgi:hypothetical protein
MNRAAVFASLPLLAVTAVAHADGEVRTETADTLVVVTPNAPVVVQQPGAAEMPPVAPPVAVPTIAPPSQAAQPAPQNEDWQNVSHINGQLVKIGERHEYLVKFKKSNISANPFGLFFGVYDAAYSYGASENIAITGSVTGYSKQNSDTTMFQFTASAPIYLRRTFDGPFLEPGIIYRSTTSGDGSSYMSSRTWAGPELLFGWHWNFDSGLNISWAFGVAKHMSDNDTSSDGYTTNESDKTDVNGYFRFGYNF